MPEGLLSFALSTFCAIFFVVDPFAAVPLYLTMVAGDGPLQRQHTAFKATLTVLMTLAVFAVAGGLIFHLFGISIGAFRVAGGALLFLMAVDMMRAHHSPTRTSEAEVAEGVEKLETGIVPLGTPMLAGPGAIATVTVLMSNARSSFLHMSIVAACIVLTAVFTAVILLAANQLQRVLKTTGLNVINRIMGLILAAVAVQFIATGVAELFPRLAGGP